MQNSTRVVIVGGGFGGLSAAKTLGAHKNVSVTVIDKRNHHLFQPLLYQVAMAGLSSAEIASPIRSLLSSYQNVEVVFDEVSEIHLETKIVKANRQSYPFDFLILACGASHSYFGRDEWQDHAPGMKSLEQAVEIRRRFLMALELAEHEQDAVRRTSLLTFVVVGGGPTGVELAGAMFETLRSILSRDFRHVNAAQARVILVEAGSRLLTSFSVESSLRAESDLAKKGVTVRLNSKVTDITEAGVTLGSELILTKTVVWAAGVQPSVTGKQLGTELDKIGRVLVEPALHIKNNPCIFVIGDQACALGKDGRPLPGLAPVAKQQGVCAARNILRALKGEPLLPFSYLDKGQMATIGRASALAEVGSLRLAGFIAWLAWIFIHILYLTGLRNRILVLVRWMWLYFTFSPGARLISEREWRK